MKRESSNSNPLRLVLIVALLFLFAAVSSSAEVINMISVQREESLRERTGEVRFAQASNDIVEAGTVSPTVTDANLYDLPLPMEEIDFSRKKRKISLPPHVSISTNFLNFDHRPTTMSSIQLVEIKNNDQGDLSLSHVSCDNPSFKVSIKTLLIAPRSSAEIAVQFQPREIDCTEGNLTITTNRGGFAVPMKGCGIFSPYKLPSLLRMKLMPDWTYNQPLTIHNPFHQPLEIYEVHTTGSFLRLALPPGSSTDSFDCSKSNSLNSAGNVECNPQKPANWTIPPWEMKLFILVSFQAQAAGEFFGSIHIKTNLHKLVIPVEITVVKDVVIPLPAELGFNVITSFNQSVVGNFSILNSGRNYVKLTKLVHVGGHHDYVTPICNFNYVPGRVLLPTSQNVVIGVSCTCKNHTSLDQFPPGFVTVRGKIALHTNLSSNPIELFYKIKVIIGRVEYNMNENTFVHLYRNRTKEGWAPINRTLTLTNNFPCSLTVYSAQILDPRFKTTMEHVPTVISSKSTWTGLSFTYYPNDTSVFSVPLMIITNLSIVSVPMRVTHGYLTPLNSTSIHVGVVSQLEKSRVTISLYNENKLTIPIWCVLRNSKLSTEVRLASMHIPSEIPFPAPNKLVFKTLQECVPSLAKNDAIVDVPFHGSVSLSVELPTTKEGNQTEQFVVVTPLESIVFNVTYRVVTGAVYVVNSINKNLELNPELSIGDPISIEQRVSIPITMLSTFDFPISLTALVTSNPMIFIHLSNAKLLPNKPTSIGNLVVDPKRNPLIKNLAFDVFTNHSKSLLQLSEEAALIRMAFLPKSSSISNLDSTYQNQNGTTKLGLEFQTDTSIRIPMKIAASFISPPLISEEELFSFTVQPKHIAFAPLIVHNPTEKDLHFQLLSSPSFNLSHSSFSIVDSNQGNTVKEATQVKTIRGGDSEILGWIRFAPKEEGDYRDSFFVKNDLTILETIQINAQSSFQQIAFSHSLQHSSLFSNGFSPSFSNHLSFSLSLLEINQIKNLESSFSKNSSQVPSPSKSDGSIEAKETHSNSQLLLSQEERRIQRNVTLVNTSNALLFIRSILINGRKCDGKSMLKIGQCLPLALLPKSKKNVTFSFLPQFEKNQFVFHVIFQDELGVNISSHRIKLLVPLESVSFISTPTFGWKPILLSILLLALSSLLSAIFFLGQSNKRTIGDDIMSLEEMNRSQSEKELKIRVKPTNTGDHLNAEGSHLKSAKEENKREKAVVTLKEMAKTATRERKNSNDSLTLKPKTETAEEIGEKSQALSSKTPPASPSKKFNPSLRSTKSPSHSRSSSGSKLAERLEDISKELAPLQKDHNKESNAHQTKTKETTEEGDNPVTIINEKESIPNKVSSVAKPERFLRKNNLSSSAPIEELIKEPERVSINKKILKKGTSAPNLKEGPKTEPATLSEERKVEFVVEDRVETTTLKTKEVKVLARRTRSHDTKEPSSTIPVILPDQEKDKVAQKVKDPTDSQKKERRGGNEKKTSNRNSLEGGNFRKLRQQKEKMQKAKEGGLNLSGEIAEKATQPLKWRMARLSKGEEEGLVTPEIIHNNKIVVTSDAPCSPISGIRGMNTANDTMCSSPKKPSIGVIGSGARNKRWTSAQEREEDRHESFQDDETTFSDATNLVPGTFSDGNFIADPNSASFRSLEDDSPLLSNDDDRSSIWDFNHAFTSSFNTYSPRQESESDDSFFSSNFVSESEEEGNAPMQKGNHPTTVVYKNWNRLYREDEIPSSPPRPTVIVYRNWNSLIRGDSRGFE